MDGTSHNDRFGDYSPKTAPDSVFDYLQQVQGGDRYGDILKTLPAPNLGHLRELLILFDEYSARANGNPGNYFEGNLILGAPVREYRPSGEELVLAELGKAIKTIASMLPTEELLNFLAKEGITRRAIVYNSFTFTHADVMGSGRFFYASEPVREIIRFE